MLTRKYSDPSKPDEQYESIGSGLMVRSFDPLEAALRDEGVLKGKGRLFISPDGELTQLPFEILPTGNGRYLIDDYRISYLSSGRDLLRFKEQSKKPKTEDIVVMYPNFNLKASNKTSSSRDLSTKQSLDLNPKKDLFRAFKWEFRRSRHKCYSRSASVDWK